MTDKFLTPEEVSRRYEGRISTRTLANWRSLRNGIGPKYFKIGGRVLYLLADILAWEATRAMALYMFPLCSMNGYLRMLMAGVT